ncbi:MAG TPA: carboxypeptidase regulatory-like domain-containing protein [Bryobacteraceae bacterium]|nr:carboxypeptidase regulatory-like domain-containing protein [Bryobacteraceae bacterium]
MSKFLSVAAAFLLLAAALPRKTFSQTLYGSIVGTVQDQSGAVIPNATITVTNKGTNQAVDTKTDEGGRYTVPNLLPGVYDVKVGGAGFRTLTRTDITVSANIITRTDLQLELGATTEQITVQADVAQIQTDKADTHTTITAQAISQMPLPGYRNYQSLMNLVPGATPTRFQNSMTDTPGRGLQTNVNGTNANNNVTRIDGAASINVWLPHHVGYVMPEDMIAEVNVTTTAADAEQGFAGGSAITLVTKTGTNEFHGGVFEFHDNQQLKARNFFQRAGTEKPLSIYNNFGGNLGGPIVKNKLFFFFNYDGTRQRQGAVATYSVPTADIRTGDFSAYSTPIYDPLTGNPDGTGRTQFPGNRIPANRISSISQKIQAYFPLPNLPGQTANLFAQGVPKLDRDYTDGKVNFNISEKSAIWGRYGRMWALSGGTGIFGDAVGPAPGADPGLGDTVVQNMSAGHTYTFSPTVLLDGVFGYQRQNQSVTANDYGQNFGETLGIPGLNGPDIRQSGFPNIDFNGATDDYRPMGAPNWMPLFRVEENFTTSHNLTWNKGAHTFRFGFDGVLLRLNHWQPELSDGGPRGYFNFDPGVTALNGGTAPTNLNSYATFLLGLPSQLQKGLQHIEMTGREWQFGWYGQDRWQATRKLTITLGLRYEYFPLMTRAAGKGLERLDPATNLVYLGGRGNVPVANGMTVSKKLFAPRAGIAYRVTENTVVRTGYGLSYDPLPFSRPLRGFYPLTVNQVFDSANSYTPYGRIENGIPPVVGPDLSTGVVALGNNSMRSPNEGEINRGYIQSWNFTVEHKLPLDLVMSAAYVGTQTTHQFADYDINSPAPGRGNAGRPYASIGRTVRTDMWDGYLSANYHSLQTTINKQFSKGLLIKGAYTWSKAINMTDDDGWANVGWNWEPVFHRNRAAAGYDRTHVFQVGWVYELPFGKGKGMMSEGPMSYILGNWQVNGLMACYTGVPFTVTAPNTSLNAGGNSNTQTADQVNPVVDRPGLIGSDGRYYDITAFRAPSDTARFGTSGRNILRNPGMWNTDLSLFKNIPIGERFNAQFRAEFFNLPNTSHFGADNSRSGAFASTDVSNANFLRVVSAFGERQIRFGLKLRF